VAIDVQEVVSGGAETIVKPSTMAFCAATMAPEPVIPKPLLSFVSHSEINWLTPERILLRRNTPEDNLGLVASYQWLYEHTEADILVYAHDDVEMHEVGWDQRIVKEFADPHVGVVGLGGGLIHGSDDLYKRPYQLQQLARFEYLSNTDDAEAHGTRFTGSREAAVLDGFVLVVRRSLLDRAGGWPVSHLRFHNYDYWICCIAHRLHYTVRVVGISSKHLGGRTSTTQAYQEWAARQGMTDQQDHEHAHRWLYDNFRDVLPWRVETNHDGNHR